MILKSLYALVCSLAFGILFNIKGKNLFFAALGGGIGWLFYEIPKQGSASTVVCLFIASIAIATYSEILARILKSPVTTFVICALIPLVPGGGMYYTMLESIQGNVTQSLNLGLETMLNAGSIAVGIAMISSTARLITYRHKKIR